MTVAAPEIVEVTELEQPRFCEHPHHADPMSRDVHDDGPATHWARTGHRCWGPVGIPYPICAAYARSWAQKSRMLVHTCMWCGGRIEISDQVYVIGTIS